MPLKPEALLQLLTSPGLRWAGLKIDQNRKLAIHIPIPNFTNKYQKVVKRISKNLRQGCHQMVGPKYRSVSTSITLLVPNGTHTQLIQRGNQPRYR